MTVAMGSLYTKNENMYNLVYSDCHCLSCRIYIMSIWLHANSSHDQQRVRKLSLATSCPYCLAELSELNNRVLKTKPSDEGSLTGTQWCVFACQVCGWWKRMEYLVARVFAEGGYKSRVTAYGSDGGIDVILDGPNDTIISVQVKRYRGKIRVHQIRELVGALVIEGMTQGIFVNTPEFTNAAVKAAANATVKGYPIKLMDSTKLFDALSIAQRAQFKDKEELLENIGEPELFLVDSHRVIKPVNP